MAGRPETLAALAADGSVTGTRVRVDRYETIKAAILAAVPAAADGIAYRDLVEAVRSRLVGFEGSIAWHVTAVKLDLEGRGLIERIPGAKPQRIRLARES